MYSCIYCEEKKCFFFLISHGNGTYSIVEGLHTSTNTHAAAVLLVFCDPDDSIPTHASDF